MGSGLVNTLTYTAREYDAESGLYHYRARAYDPTLGRFLQKDLLQGKLMWPQTQHLYTYCLNNPVNFTDPTGQCVAISYTILASASSRMDNCESMKEICKRICFGFCMIITRHPLGIPLCIGLCHYACEAAYPC